jgi:hypothetical protein
MPPAPFHHHVDLVMSDIALDASYGLAPWLAAEVRFAVRIVDLTPSYTEVDGTPKRVENDPHHHDVTLAGPTDPSLVLRFASRAGRLGTSARIGISVPLGVTEPNPYVLGAKGIAHEHTQLGTGTLLPIAGIGLSLQLAPIDLHVSALGLFSLSENDQGYRAPSRFFPSLRATWPLLGGSLKPYASIDLPGSTGERWEGLPGLEGDGQGRMELLLGGGISWRFLDPWQVDLGLRARATTLMGGAGFDYPGLLEVGISTYYGAGSKASR